MEDLTSAHVRGRRRKRRIFSVLAALAGVALFAGCTANEAPSRKPRSPVARDQDDDTSRAPPEDVEVELEPEPSSEELPPAGTDDEPTWCQESAADATFCADFDRTLELGWTARGGAHGEARLVQGGLSAPNAFAAQTEPVGDGIVARAYLRKDFAQAPQDEIDYTFAVRLEQVGALPNKGGTLAVLQVGKAPDDYELQLNVASTGALVIMERGPMVDGGPRRYVQHKLGSLAMRTWTRISIRVKFGENSAFKASVDALEVLNDVRTVVPLPRIAPSLYVGITYVDPPSATWDVRYDDVVVQLR